MPPIIGTGAMFSVFISRTVSSEPHMDKSVASQQLVDKPPSVKFSNAHVRRSNIFQCPVYAAQMVLTTRKQKKITSLGSELIVARVLAYKIFTANISSHKTRKSERVICPSVILQVVHSALFQAS